MSLLASSSESKYFNDVTLWVDSLTSTPEGKAQYHQILEKACMTVDSNGNITVDLSKGPIKQTSLYVLSNPSDNQLTVYDKFGDELEYYSEPFDELTWEIEGDSSENVLGYECVLAHSDYHGRHWRAWFTQDIPIQSGPWKLRGLPGLILKADADGIFIFTATGI